MPHSFDRRDVLLAVTVGAVAFVVSVVGSGNASLWGDEAASVLSAQRPLASLATMVQHVDAVHGLYYLGLHFWIEMFGASPFSIRFPSAVAVGVAAAGVVLVGRLIQGLRFGVLAGLVAAVLPRLTDVGSEARSYAMTAAIATWLSVVLLLILRSEAPRRRLWVAYGILLAVGTSLFIWLALVAVSHLVVLLIARSALGRAPGLIFGWVVTTVIAMAASSPVLLFALLERDQIAYLATRQTYDVTSLFVSPWFESPAVAIGAWALMLGGISLSVRAAISTRERRRGTLLLPLVWMVLPTVVLLGFSALIAVYTPRYLAMCAPAVALLIATPIDAFAASRRRVEAGISLAVVVALAAPIWLAQRGPYAKNNSDWATISAELAARSSPGDAVAFDDSVRPSRRTRLALRTYPAGFRGLLDPTIETPYWRTDSWYDETYTLARTQALGKLDGVKRIWLVEYAISGVADTDGVTTLEAAGFHQVASIDNHRSKVLEFVRP